MNLIKRSHIYTRLPLLLLVPFILGSLISGDHDMADRSEIVCRNDLVTVECVGESPELAVAYLRSGKLYATEDLFVYEMTRGSSTFEELGRLPKIGSGPLAQGKDFIARLKLTRKIRKNFGANNVVVLASGTILVIYDHIYRSADGGRSFQAVYGFVESGTSDPFLHGIAVDRHDGVYFGEYTTGKRPQSPRILKGSNDGRDWSVFYQFPSGKVWHVHSVKYDVYRDRLWVCTGDHDDECNLLYFEPGDVEPRVLGSGDQGWRIVSLIPTEQQLYWCSDDISTGSRIYRYDFATGKREEIQFVGKPCADSVRLTDGTLVFSTVFEPGSPYTKQARPHPSAEIWASPDGNAFQKILELPGREADWRDAGRKTRILFPSGNESADCLYFTPIYTEDLAFTVQQCTIRWHSSPGASPTSSVPERS